MAIEPLLHPEVLTAEQRWSRWEQRGSDADVRLRRQARVLAYSGLAIVAAVLLFSLLS